MDDVKWEMKRSRSIPEYKDGYGYLRVKVPINCAFCHYRMKVYGADVCTENAAHNITNVTHRPVWCPIMNEKELITRYGDGFNTDR